MTITSLKSRFKKLKTFESNFEFLYELKECYVKFYSIFSHDNLSDHDVDDIFSELRLLQFVLPVETIFAIDILKFVKFADCYLNVSIAYIVLPIVYATV
jgi:hypothetical protein